MNELIILVGPPAAGKSTWSKEKVQQNPNMLIVGRDKLRELFYGYNEYTLQDHFESLWLKEREATITILQNTLIERALVIGHTVIMDDTNCNLERLKATIDRYKERHLVSVEMFYTPLDVCLTRNAERGRIVPIETIQRYHTNFQQIREYFNENPLRRNDNRST
jgi:predicted kinase